MAIFTYVASWLVPAGDAVKILINAVVLDPAVCNVAGATTPPNSPAPI
jgi:hypothetical protein